MIPMSQIAVHPRPEARLHARRLERMMHRGHMQKHFATMMEEAEPLDLLQVTDKWIDQQSKRYHTSTEQMKS